MVKERKFREDLYFRLAVAQVHVPPLRERSDDIPMLVEHLLSRIGPELHRQVTAIEDEAIRLLKAYPWPGNVRELQNVLTRALLLTRGDTLTAKGLEQVLGDVEGVKTESGQETEVLTLREAEKNHIRKALSFHGWNITHTAKALDISPTTLRKKIDDYDLRA